MEWFDWNSLLDSQPFPREEVWDRPGQDPGADSGLELGLFPLSSVDEAIFQPDLAIPAHPGQPSWLPGGFPNRIRHGFRISPFFWGGFSKSKSEDSTPFPEKNSSFPQRRAGSRRRRPPAPPPDLENPHPAPKIPCFPARIPCFSPKLYPAQASRWNPAILGFIPCIYFHKLSAPPGEVGTGTGWNSRECRPRTAQPPRLTRETPTGIPPDSLGIFYSRFSYKKEIPSALIPARCGWLEGLGIWGNLGFLPSFFLGLLGSFQVLIPW